MRVFVGGGAKCLRRSPAQRHRQRPGGGAQCGSYTILNEERLPDRLLFGHVVLCVQRWFQADSSFRSNRTKEQPKADELWIGRSCVEAAFIVRPFLCWTAAHTADRLARCQGCCENRIRKDPLGRSVRL